MMVGSKSCELCSSVMSDRSICERCFVRRISRYCRKPTAVDLSPKAGELSSKKKAHPGLARASFEVASEDAYKKLSLQGVLQMILKSSASRIGIYQSSQVVELPKTEEDWFGKLFNSSLGRQALKSEQQVTVTEVCFKIMRSEGNDLCDGGKKRAPLAPEYSLPGCAKGEYQPEIGVHKDYAFLLNQITDKKREMALPTAESKLGCKAEPLLQKMESAKPPRPPKAVFSIRYEYVSSGRVNAAPLNMPLWRRRDMTKPSELQISAPTDPFGPCISHSP
ncbi:hypothetical protein O6H91_19G065400 [Diphasiastrum complanatum]|uniref:Uncharacterized protein n=2 Tax=Diphasiastrum complanatum TaxID=34168 RepID=A0ACC2AW79_DIPCM|nr:hypothetical protein O6H91_19G064900 [Diphasiastrum complanatum]KAJ7521736.1 hypothetical protein O6H91_19G065400 [Diphasiastrum complanatum]